MTTAPGLKSTYRLSAVAIGALLFAGVAFLLIGSFVDGLMRDEAGARAKTLAENVVSRHADVSESGLNTETLNQAGTWLEQSRGHGNFWRYQIFDARGALAIDSQTSAPLVGQSLKSLHPDAVDNINLSGIHMETRTGLTGHEPAYLSETIVPLTNGGNRIGFLGLTIDETSHRTVIQERARMLLVMFVGIVLLAFIIPAAGLLRRTHQKEVAEDKLSYLAYHDTLTGLKNRHAITQFLISTLASAKAESVAVHIVDLDNFKTINDTLGHDAGDECLIEVASRLTQVADGHGLIGRLGGDEFLIVQTDATSREMTEKFARRIVKELSKPSTLSGTLVDTGASVGTARYPDDGKRTADLMKSADTALYAAKNAGRRCFRLFKPEYDESLRRRRMIESKVRQALDSDGFTQMFQPIINMETKVVESVESLLRLHDPELGQISPSEFIPIAEEAGLIEGIGDWVIFESCRMLALLPAHLSLSLNLSPVQFGRGDLVSTIAKAITQAQVNPRRLELEITESLLIKDSDGVFDKIERLKALGCSLVLDDFGSGYSSLSYLWRFPFDKIKVDRDFVASLAKNPEVAAITEVIIDLARKLKMGVTAEGVETIEQENMLRLLGCNQAQGYYYARPMAMPELTAYLLREQLAQQGPQLPKDGKPRLVKSS